MSFRGQWMGGGERLGVDREGGVGVELVWSGIERFGQNVQLMYMRLRGSNKYALIKGSVSAETGQKCSYAQLH